MDVDSTTIQYLWLSMENVFLLISGGMGFIWSIIYLHGCEYFSCFMSLLSNAAAQKDPREIPQPAQFLCIPLQTHLIQAPLNHILFVDSWTLWVKVSSLPLDGNISRSETIASHRWNVRTQPCSYPVCCFRFVSSCQGGSESCASKMIQECQEILGFSVI